MEAKKASDLFISVGKKPCMRVMRKLEIVDAEVIVRGDFETFLKEHLPPGTTERLAEKRDLDIGLSLPDKGRFRLNLSFERGNMSTAIRRVPSGALAFKDLLIPDVVRTLAESPRGLILITGATGSGKSTTMAAILHYINSKFDRHIVTIEDPIEFIHADRESVISQREIGSDTLSFATALRHVVRQNPDVIFIGEMRDLETIQTAISAAMTGHLVVSTMHTIDTTQTLERIINYFPSHLRDQVALDFSMALTGIVSQRLLRRMDGKGVVPAFEILCATPTVRRVIARREFAEIEEAIKAAAAEGMQTFTRSLVKLCQQNLISTEIAAAAATNKEEFLLAVQGMETGIDTLRSFEKDDSDDRRKNMKGLLKSAVKHDASDLHITVGSPPLLRIDGLLRELNMDPLKPSETRKLLFSVLTPSQRALFEADNEIDFALSVNQSFGIEQEGGNHTHRFRVNGFYEKGCVAIALRVIPQTIPNATELMIPPVVLDLAHRHQGLVLVTGPTGHGKSTSLACLIDEINRTRSCHIITVEDPIEFVHSNRMAMVQQREVHADTKSFTNALKYVLRQDPDVILIGEMRDPETISAALTAAETGHLVLATLHTNDAMQTIDRIIDSFPSHQQNQIRMQLASCLVAVVAQRLLPKVGGTGRVPGFEILLGTTPVRALIRDSRTHQIQSAMETSAKDGMITMDKALLNLYNRNLISRQTIKTMARDPNII